MVSVSSAYVPQILSVASTADSARPCLRAIACCSSVGVLARRLPILRAVCTQDSAQCAAPRSMSRSLHGRMKTGVKKDGTITAASSSSISDGAAAVVLTRDSIAKARGLAPVARIVAVAAHAQKPATFTTAPIGAIHSVLDKAGWSIDDVDLFEINEAFACVAMFAMHDLDIPHDKINVHGGATALGHPIGASSTRIITTLIGALKGKGLKRGVASLCIGGGEATAIAVELL